MSRIKIVFPAQEVEIEIELLDSLLSDRILDIIPYESTVNTWGEEIYFNIPLHVPIERGQEVVSPGDVAYWPDGACLCLFFGPTPASRAPGEIRPASPVEVVGKIDGDLGLLKSIPVDAPVKITVPDSEQGG